MTGQHNSDIDLRIKDKISYINMLFWGRRGQYKEVWDKTAIIYPGHLSSDQCQRARNIIDDILHNSNGINIWEDSHASDQRIFAFEDAFPEIKSWLNIDHQIRQVERYIGRQIRSWFLMANKVTYKTNNKGSGGGFHRDSPFSNQLKLIWYLNDVTGANGPFEYVPETNKNLARDKADFPLGQTRFNTTSKRTVKMVTGCEGTLLVCDTKCVHRGKPIERGTRYAITLYTSPNPNAKSKHLSTATRS